MALAVGDWVLNDSNGPIQPIWLGRVIGNPDPVWKGKGVFKNDTGKTIRYDTGVEIRPVQQGIFIMWYDKIDINSDDLDYHVSRTDVVPTVQHNEYMVMQGFKMIK